MAQQSGLRRSLRTHATQKLKIDDFLQGSFRHFQDLWHYVALCQSLRSTDTAIHENNTFAGSPNYCACHEIARCTKCCACHEKRQASIETLLNIALVSLSLKTQTPTKRNKNTLFAMKWTSSTSSGSHFLCTAKSDALIANTLRTVAVVETTLGEHDSNFQTSRVKRGAFRKYK